jgi:iron only hydrogenase large subunit-like protein
MEPVDGYPGLFAAEMVLPDGTPVRLGIVSGMGNIKNVIAAIESKELAFDIVEVMACPGGCIGGGGQPFPNETYQREKRTSGLVIGDKRQQIRIAHDNILVCELYDRWLKETNSDVAHEYLHTHYHKRNRETEPAKS